MSDVLVEVTGISKKFCRSLKRSLWYGVQDVASELLGSKGRHDKLRKNEFWAVDNVSFELHRGECLGLIGPNGAGKSTLLKMLNGLIKPDRGRISMRGRVGALIELGAGFNPILTARENIYVNGSVLGFSSKEVDRKFDEIVDFAEIEDFLETPVQNFSSGMKVRLGFSVASQFEPEILIVDEVLAVGDTKFRLKCMNRISEISKSAAVIVVSHSMPMISRMSSKLLLLDHAQSEYLGDDVQVGIEKYLATITPEKSPEISEYIHLSALEIDSNCKNSSASGYEIDFGSDLLIQMAFEVQHSAGDCLVNVSFLDMENKMVAQCFSFYSGFKVTLSEGSTAIKLELQNLCLNPGRYSLQIDLVESLPGHRRGAIIYKNPSAALISVIGNLTGWAPVQFVGKWNRLESSNNHRV